VSTAQANAAASKAMQFRCDRKKFFGVVQVDGEALMASRSADGAFWEARKHEMDQGLDAMGEEISYQLFQNGYGNRGRISAISTGVITLTNPGDVKYFRINMKLSADTGATAAGTRRAGTGYVISMNEDAGTITVSATLGGAAGDPTAWANNDYLFRNGFEGTTYNIEGLASIIPLTAPAAAESFRSNDRSVDTRRLAGVRLDDTSTSIEECAGNVAMRIKEVGKNATSLYLSPKNLWDMLKRQTSKVVLDAGGEATFGFGSAKIQTPAGILTAYADPLCPDNRGYVLTDSTWYLKSGLSAPHVISDDGNVDLRQASDDGIEVRMRFMGNLICTEPGANGVFSIAV
jgi:hypothetical protein